MKAWRAKMNAALGAAREAQRQGNMAAAAAYHQAAMNRAVNRGTSQTISNVAAQAPPTPGGINARPAPAPAPAPAHTPTPAAPAHTPQTTYTPSAPAPTPAPAPPPPPPPKPHNPWITTSDYSEPVGVKQADPDIVLFDTESISPELLLQLEYEVVSGTELINISRSDIIDGIEVVYSPIKNLSSLRRKFNPNNIIAMPSTSSSLFSKYPVDLINRGPYEPYFNENGDLVIEIEDVREDELIEVEVDSSGTINTVDFS